MNRGLILLKTNLRKSLTFKMLIVRFSFRLSIGNNIKRSDVSFKLKQKYQSLTDKVRSYLHCFSFIFQKELLEVYFMFEDLIL